MPCRIVTFHLIGLLCFEQELVDLAPYPLTYDLPLDETRLADVNTDHFHGVRTVCLPKEATSLSDNHMKVTIR